MKTVLVTGGTGQLGREVVPMLRAAGHQVRIASRNPAPPAPAGPAADWATVDYRSGAGLIAALTGVDAVVHCASGSARGEHETITALLGAIQSLPADRPAPHLVYISIVGVDRIPMKYYTAKLATEQAIEASGLPYSILRATQFHSLILSFVKALSKLPVLLMPKGLKFQPIALQPVAERLSELTAGAPQGRVADIGGPQVQTLRELAGEYQQKVGTSKKTVEISIPGRFVAAMRAGENLTPEHAVPGQTFREYLLTSR